MSRHSGSGIELLSLYRGSQPLVTSSLVPIVIEQTPQGERAYDIYSRLLKERIIFLHGVIEAGMADTIIAQLIYLNQQDPNGEIHLYMNSPGGYVSAGLAIYDTMRFVKAPVATSCVGTCASMAAVLFCAGDKGLRNCLPNAEVMIHQPLGAAEGQQTDIEISAAHIKRTRERLERIIAEHTGQPFEKVHADCERDNYLTAGQAKDYGLADLVVPFSKKRILSATDEDSPAKP